MLFVGRSQLGHDRAWVHAALDRVLLGGLPEGVPAHRVEDIVAPHCLEAGHDIAGDVVLAVPDV